jgi:quercetin dioxygenase-like cupin family protein
MNDKPNWQVAHLGDIKRGGSDRPMRELLGIHAFGINVRTRSEDGTLINEHDEAGSGQEELYIVLDGKVTFEIDGEAVDAQPGTLVFVGPQSRRKATGDGTVLVVGAKPGEAYQGIDWGHAWPFHSESMTAYREQRYADALEAVRGALEQMPGHAGLHYNYACFSALAGDTSDDMFAHLRRSSSCSRGSARTHAQTTTSQQYATTRGSSGSSLSAQGLDSPPSDATPARSRRSPLLVRDDHLVEPEPPTRRPGCDPEPPPRRRRVPPTPSTPEVRNQLRARFRAGASIADLAAKLGEPWVVVREWVRSSG